MMYDKTKKTKNQETAKILNKRKIQQPTQERHKLLLKTISDNLGKGMPMGEAMRAVGYSESYSENPDQLRETDAWKDLVRREIKDEKLVQVLNGLLNHKEWRARDAGLDKGLKIKGNYAPDKHEVKFKRPVRDIEEEIAGTLSEALEIISRKE